MKFNCGEHVLFVRQMEAFFGEGPMCGVVRPRSRVSHVYGFFGAGVKHGDKRHLQLIHKVWHQFAEIIHPILDSNSHPWLSLDPARFDICPDAKSVCFFAKKANLFLHVLAPLGALFEYIVLEFIGCQLI